MRGGPYKFVASRAKHLCEYCHAPEAFFNNRLQIDHIIPKAFGGTDDSENLALACPSCNSHKYQKQFALDRVLKKSVRLFNPRRDAWEKHFRWNRTQTRILGRTAIGRATISALKMNRRRQVDARILWQFIRNLS